MGTQGSRASPPSGGGGGGVDAAFKFALKHRREDRRNSLRAGVAPGQWAGAAGTGHLQTAGGGSQPTVYGLTF